MDIKDEFGNSLLHLAIKAKNIERVRELLRYPDVQINQGNNWGNTPLHWAMKYDYEDCALELIIHSNNFTIFMKSNIGQTPLHWAARYGSVNCMLLLLFDNLPDIIDKFGNIPLHLAAQEGHVECVKHLVKFQNTNKQNNWGNTPLHLAAMRGHYLIVQILLDSVIDSVTIKNNKQKIPSEVAKTKKIQKLINTHEVLITCPQKNGITCKNLQYAIEFNHPKCIEQFLHMEVDVNKSFDGTTPLLRALQFNYIECVLSLLKFNANVNITDTNGVSALHISASNGNIECITLLLSRGAKIDGTERLGRTPLHYAAIRGQNESIKALCSHGANIAKKELLGGFNTLHAAAYSGHAECIHTLINLLRDVDYIDARDNYYNTPLHKAAERGNVECVRALLEHGVDRNVKNLRGKTAADMAKSEEIKEMIENYQEIPYSKHCLG